MNLTSTEFFLSIILGTFIAFWVKNNVWRLHRCHYCKKLMCFSSENKVYCLDLKTSAELIAHAKCFTKNNGMDWSR